MLNCTVCGENYVWKINLKSHIEEIHSLKKQSEEFEAENVEKSNLGSPQSNVCDKVEESYLDS